MLSRLTSMFPAPPGGWTGWLAFCLVAVSFGVTARGADAELRTAAAVRELTVEQARQKLNVRLRGVVTFYNSRLFSYFIQDDTAGIYLFEPNLPSDIPPGQLVEVEGTTSPGDYAPIVVPSKVRVVGQGALPPAKPVTFQQLASGTEDSQFVEFEGIVRSVHLDETSQHQLIEIATGGGRLLVYARELPVKRAEEFVDSTVRVRAVCETQFNHRRQLFAVRLLVPRPEDLAIEMPAPTELLALSARPIGSLLQFTPRETYGHRVKVAGTLVGQEPGRVLYLQDGEHGLEVQTRGTELLQPGDKVEAVGFPDRGQYTPVLQDATCRRLQSGPPIPAALVSPDEVLTGSRDYCLIRVRATLLDRGESDGERFLLLQEKGFIFSAFLPQTNGADPFAGLAKGSRVEVTGICKIEPGAWRASDDWRAKSFLLRLRAAEDLVILGAPPWWTLGKVLWILGGVGLVALTAFCWVLVLHRQVAERTRQLETQIRERQRAERQRLIEQERARVAQDLHDELGATLTEVSMLGSLARTPVLPPENKERYLEQLTEVSRALVATLDEIVWAVNPKYDSVASLASYYSLFAQRFLKLADMPCRLHVAESFPDSPMDSRLRHHVFLAFKEALNNAVRHSRASEVRITMEVVKNQLRIIVGDNGKGFTAEPDLPGSDGLAGMQQRMQKLGGECRIRSQAGEGTIVEFCLPLGE